MMAANDVGDVKKSVMHQPLLSPDGPLVVVALVWAGVSTQYTTALHFVNDTVTSPYYLKNISDPFIVPLHEQH